jgi:hypothetical protein
LVCSTKKSLATLRPYMISHQVKYNFACSDLSKGSCVTGRPDEFVTKSPKMWPNPFLVKKLRIPTTFFYRDQ